MLKVDYRYGNYQTKDTIKSNAERFGISWRAYCSVLGLVRYLRDENPGYRFGQQVALDGLHGECLRFARGQMTQEAFVSWVIKYWKFDIITFCEYIEKITKK